MLMRAVNENRHSTSRSGNSGPARLSCTHRARQGFPGQRPTRLPATGHDPDFGPDRRRTLDDAATDGGGGAQALRSVLSDCGTGTVEILRADPQCTQRIYEARHRVLLPYLGLFRVQAGPVQVLADSNSTVFVSAGREWVYTHPLPDVGHESLIITPAQAVLDEICGGGDPAEHTAFLTATQPASGRLKLLTEFLLRGGPSGRDPMQADELLASVLEEALSRSDSRPARQSKVIARAKEMLHTYPHIVLSLEEVARQVGVTSVYLTQEFTRSEGVPLYRYQKRLRLNRALRELPHCQDITALALDLGFSSHSHFSCAFRQQFGMTPSDYRAGRRLKLISAATSLHA